jgi:hypothetical protein
MTSKGLRFALLILCVLLSGTALGQRTTATLYGVVQDPGGGVVPGATVELTNEETNIVLTVVSNDVGEFTAAFVPIGRYTLKIELTGFKTHVRTGLQLTANQQIRYPVTLEIGEVSDVTTVTAETALLQSASVTSADAISRLQLGELPQGRRDFASLLGLQNGVRFDKQGLFTINGLAPGGMSITVDGVDASGDPETPSVSAFQGFNNINVMSQEAIQEVVVSKDVMSAEVARSFSGNVNVISKSGTNEFHGSLFETIQNDALNANYAWATAAQKTPIRYNQFGGSLGGPIVKDKAFFFFTYEGYRERSSSVKTETVPTREFREQAIAVYPVSRAYFDLWPDPTEEYAPGAASALARYVDTDTKNDDHLVLRGDYSIDSNNLLAARYTRSRPDRVQPRPAKGNPRIYEGKSDTANITWTRSSATWTNELRTGLKFDDTQRSDVIYAEGKIPGIRIDGDAGFRADGSGMALIGHQYSLEEVYAKTMGRHTLKIGGMYLSRSPGRYDEESPLFRYSNSKDFLSGKLREATFTFGQPRYYGRLRELSGFIQDDFRAKPNLVLNLGIRYDYFSVFKEKNGQIFNPGTITNAVQVPGVFRDPDSLYEADFNNFQPRVGFAWGIGQAGKTVIRSGFGMNVAPPNPRGFATMVYVSPMVPFRVTLTRNDASALGVAYPMSNEDLIPIVTAQNFPRSYKVFQENNRNPYAMHWKLDIQRQLTQDMVFETGYVGNKAVKIAMTRLGNLPDRLTGIRPVPEAGSFGYTDNSDFSYYHAWQTSLRKNLSHSVAFGANYTWSKAMAICQGDFWPGNDTRAQDDNNLRADLGPTSNDRTHRFSTNWFWEAPFADWLEARGLLRGLIGGWRFGGIFNATSGSPLNVEQRSSIDFSRPDYIGGDPYLTAPDPANYQVWYINPAAFQPVPIISASGMTARPGNTGKNSLRGPGSWDFDLSGSKQVAITEAVQLQVRAEMLNALNHHNLNNPATDITRDTFGKILGVSGPRVIQMSLRLTF